MDDKKFCKFCGEKIDISSIVCPKCGRQLKTLNDSEEDITTNNNDETKNDKPKFYEQVWFMWVMLVFFAPIGIFFMWKFHSEMKKKTKIILTIVFAILFIIIVATNKSSSNETSLNDKDGRITVISFSSMDRNAINTWCNNNKINCEIAEEYSDTIPAGSFIRQSVRANNKINEGDSIIITISLGKKTIEYIKVSKDDLDEALDNNAAAAKDTYNKKYVEVTGKLGTIDSDLKYISLISSTEKWDFNGIHCTIKNNEQKEIVKTLIKNQSLIIRGRITDVGEVLGYYLDITEIIPN